MSILTHLSEGKRIHLNISSDQNYIRNYAGVQNFHLIPDKSVLEFKCDVCSLEDICSEFEILSNKMPCHSVNREDGEDGYFQFCGECVDCPKFDTIEQD